MKPCYQEKYNCYKVYNRAIRKGEIARPEICSMCGHRTIRIHGHHKDYRKPLDIQWLCTTCHGHIHGARTRFIKEKYGHKHFEKHEFYRIGMGILGGDADIDSVFKKLRLGTEIIGDYSIYSMEDYYILERYSTTVDGSTTGKDAHI